MTLEEFAQLSGVIIVKNEASFYPVRPYEYYEKEYPALVYCDYRTKKAAYEGWFKENFTAAQRKALRKLFNVNERIINAPLSTKPK